MREVTIIGVGQTPVGEHWELSLKQLTSQAIRDALADAGDPPVDALYVGNMLAGQLSRQGQLGAYAADFAGLRGIEAYSVEAACGSGAAAVRAGIMAVASGEVDMAVACGVEKMTNSSGAEVTAGLAMAADADDEVIMGGSFVAINALLMQRYLYEYKVPDDAFAPFPVNAHANARNNPNAMFHINLTPEGYARSPMISPPIRLMDSSPICDGAAAVVLCAADRARELCESPVRVAASAVATDSLALHDRHDLLGLQGAAASARRAYAQAGIGPEDVDFFEAHDAFSIMTVLSLEASGFAERGKGTRLGLDGEIGIGGRLPVNTMGGLKARGHPVGATGVYQIVETAIQLRGKAGANQVQGARFGMAQNIGGSGATVITHILEAAR